MLFLMGCANNQQETIATICNGVKASKNTCSTAVLLAGKCTKCSASSEKRQKNSNIIVNASAFELQENNLAW